MLYIIGTICVWQSNNDYISCVVPSPFRPPGFERVCERVRVCVPVAPRPYASSPDLIWRRHEFRSAGTSSSSSTRYRRRRCCRHLRRRRTQ